MMSAVTGCPRRALVALAALAAAAWLIAAGAPGALAREVIIQTPKGPVKVNVDDDVLTGMKKTKPDAEYIADQKKHPELIKQKVGLDVKTVETDHFIVHGDVDDALLNETAGVLEKLHEEFNKMFKPGDKDKLYAGKLEMFVWKTREEFIKFAAAWDSYDARAAGGYFRSTGVLCHVNMFYESDSKNPAAAKARYLEVTIHEFTHAHLTFYRTGNRLRPWVQEGMANLMAWYIIRRYGTRDLESQLATKDRFVMLLRQRIGSKDARTMKDLMRQPVIPPTDIEGYATAWIATANLAAIKNGEVYMKFVNALKDEPPETATPLDQAALDKSYEYQDAKFKECFGMTPDQFDAWLRSWLKQNSARFDKAFAFQ